jgi:VPDSG-CTERM motif
MRKSVIVTLVVCSLVVLSGVTGRAGTLWDIDVFFKYLSGETATYTGYFDIKGKYNSALERVTDAYAWFLVLDDQWFDKGEKVALNLGDKPFCGPSNASFNILGGQICGDALVTLDTTGTLKYTFCRTEGDFLALAAKLYVETCPKAVPDGGTTLMLLGVALAGIEPLRRRMVRRNTQRNRQGCNHQGSV